MQLVPRSMLAEAPVAAVAPRATWLRGVRARQWAHFVVLPAATWSGAATSASAWPLARGAAVAALVLAYGYLLNAAADRATDLDRGKNPLVDEGGAETGARAAALGLASLALVLAATGPWLVAAATATALASGAVYSAGPRLKAYPGVGTLLNVTNFAPLLLVGAAGASVPPGTATLVATFAALLVQNQLLHEAADATEDRRGGVRTTFLSLGARGAALAAAAAGGLSAWAIAASGAGSLGSALAVAAALVWGASFPMWLLRAGGDGAAMKRARLWHRVASGAGGAALFALLRFPH